MATAHNTELFHLGRLREPGKRERRYNQKTRIWVLVPSLLNYHSVGMAPSFGFSGLYSYTHWRYKYCHITSISFISNKASISSLLNLLIPMNYPRNSRGFSSVQSLSHLQLFATPWITACQASLSITNSRSSPKLMCIESVMPSSHLILYCPLLLLPPIPPSTRVFSNESTLHMRWPKYWSFRLSISPSNEHPGLVSFRMDWLDLLAVQGTQGVLKPIKRFLLPRGMENSVWSAKRPALISLLELVLYQNCRGSTAVISAGKHCFRFQHSLQSLFEGRKSQSL